MCVCVCVYACVRVCIYLCVLRFFSFLIILCGKAYVS